jgi:hypothetical protein
MNPRPLLLAATSAAVTFASMPSDACSPQMCVGGQFLPTEATVVPANAPAIWWWPDRSNGTGDLALPIDDSSYDLALLDQGTETTLAVQIEPGPSFGGFFLVPKDPMPAGKTIRVRGANFCQNATGVLDDTASVAVFETSASAPLPTDLGVLMATPSVVEPLVLADGSGSCGSTVTAATVRVTLELSAGALPWKDVFAFETYVDGESWGGSHHIAREPVIGSSWEGRGMDLMFSICETPAGSFPVVEPLDEGSHEVKMRAWVPGSSTVVETPSIQFTLSCDETDAGVVDAAVDGEADANADANADAEVDAQADALTDALIDVLIDVEVDASPDAMTDGGSDVAVDTTPETDSGVDAGSDGSVGTSPSGDGSEDGCSCSTVGVTGWGRTSFAGLVGLLLVVLGTRRRR